jgi:hypothetical protein
VLDGGDGFLLGRTPLGQPLSGVRMKTNGHALPGPRFRAAKVAIEQWSVCGP